MLLLNCLVILYKGTCSLLETECWCLSPFPSTGMFKPNLIVLVLEDQEFREGN